MAKDDPTPLSAAQRARIVTSVRNHRQLGPLLKGRARVVVAEPHIARGTAPGDALVAIYDYDKDRTLVARVRSTRGRVMSVAEAPAPFQLSDEEEKEAEALARTDKRVKSFLGRRQMNPLTRLYFPPKGSQHRYAIVFLRPNSSERSYAVVDLSNRRVVEVLSQADFTG
jgi:hypothetical protein